MTDIDFRLPSFDAALAALPPSPSGDGALDESFWDAVRALYPSSRALVNLEHGYFGAMAEPVQAMFRHWTERINHETTLLIREHWPQMLEDLRDALAGALGCERDEVVLTRGATEAMFALIGGYNRLQPGDNVLYCDLDYPAMRNAMEWLRERRGAVPVSFAIPEPATRDGVIDAYAQMLRRHPRTRLVLLTHLSHLTGLVMPVRELAAMARAAGADVIVDAAHSWGQIDFDVADLDAPYVAFNLHKWIGAPLGCGALYIRRGHLPAIDTWFGDRDHPADDIRSRVHTGSPNFAAWLAIPSALQLHRRIGAHAKEARLRHLRDHWVRRARALPGIEILTPDDASMVAGITAFRLARGGSSDAERSIAETLRDRFGVYTVQRERPGGGDAVRVTPSIATTHADLDRLLDGLRALASARSLDTL